MGFTELVGLGLAPNAGKATISYSRSKLNPMPKLYVGLPARVLEHHQDGQRYAFMLGEGEDSGKARIVLSDHGSGVLHRSRNGGGCIRFGHIPMLGEDVAAKEFVAIRLADGAICEIDVPAWLKRDSVG